MPHGVFFVNSHDFDILTGFDDCVISAECHETGVEPDNVNIGMGLEQIF